MISVSQLEADVRVVVVVENGDRFTSVADAVEYFEADRGRARSSIILRSKNS